MSDQKQPSHFAAGESSETVPGGRTQRAIQSCGEWLAACLKAGWARHDLDALEHLWWENHDERGNLKPSARLGADNASPRSDEMNSKEST